jgi:hypothetical protein
VFTPYIEFIAIESLRKVKHGLKVSENQIVTTQVKRKIPTDKVEAFTKMWTSTNDKQ